MGFQASVVQKWHCTRLYFVALIEIFLSIFLHFDYFFLLQIEKSEYFCRFYAKNDNIS